MLPRQLQALINQFSQLPGIGPRQAARFVFYLLRNRHEIKFFQNTLKELESKIDLCPKCFLPSPKKMCTICENPRRDKNLICVVEKETDAVNLEKTGHFKGHYYVLGGFINPLEKENLSYARLSYFIEMIGGKDADTEIILALSPRREGDFTSIYIEERLKKMEARNANIKITRLGRGLSSGAELEYADEETLKNAFEGRR